MTDNVMNSVAKVFIQGLAARFAEGLRYVHNDPAADKGTVKKCIHEFISAARTFDETYDGTSFIQDATEAFSTDKLSDPAIARLKEKLSGKLEFDDEPEDVCTCGHSVLDHDFDGICFGNIDEERCQCREYEKSDSAGEENNG